MGTRDAILATALALFSSRGYDAVGVQEIAAGSGVTKPTLYHWFGSKENLLRTIFDDHFDTLVPRLRDAAPYRRDVATTLRGAAGFLTDYAGRHPEFYRMLLAFSFAPPGNPASVLARSYQERLFRVLEDLFLAAEADHGNMRGRAARYAASFLGHVNALVSLSLYGEGERREDAVRDAVHQFMHGIFS
jgi:AcrR family transcriptional regulator